MDTFTEGLSCEHNRMLMQLGRAAIEANSLEEFQYRCIRGYPYAWVLHPSLSDVTFVAGYEHLLFLDHLGYIQLRSEGLLPTGAFLLTPAGLARYAEMELFQALWGTDSAIDTPGLPETRQYLPIPSTEYRETRAQ